MGADYYYMCSCTSQNYMPEKEFLKHKKQGYFICKCGDSIGVKKCNRKNQKDKDAIYQTRLKSNDNKRGKHKNVSSMPKAGTEKQIVDLSNRFNEQCRITDKKANTNTTGQHRKRKSDHAIEKDDDQLPGNIKLPIQNGNDKKDNTKKIKVSSTPPEKTIFDGGKRKSYHVIEKDDDQVPAKTKSKAHKLGQIGDYTNDTTTIKVSSKRPEEEIIGGETKPNHDEIRKKLNMETDSTQKKRLTSANSFNSIPEKENDKRNQKAFDSYKDQKSETKERKRSKESHKQKSLKGLPNVGMTCYVNSLLQVLSQTPGFLYHIQTLSDYLSDNSVTRSFCSVIDQMSCDTGSSVLAYNQLYHLINGVCRRNNGFSIGSQNDSHFFMTTLFEIIKEEAAAVDFNALNMFEGYLQNRFSYESCGHTEKSARQMFNSLVVPITKDVKEWSVENGMSKFSEVEWFPENEIPCKKCGYTAMTNSTELCYTKFETVLSRLPEILILQLGRFQERHSARSGIIVKNNKSVWYPPSLKLDSTENSKTYYLYGVVNHSGSLSGGHYTAYVRRLTTDSDFTDSVWYSCSDSHTARIDEEYVYRNSSAYLLFYYS